VAQTSPTISFSANNYVVSENGSSVVAFVTRGGDLSAQSTVDFATSDGTAAQRNKYLVSAGTLKFLPGESSKTIKILLIDNTIRDGSKSFTITLSNATGATLNAALAMTTINITDDDTNRINTNALDDSQYFVRQQYLDFLNRQPDAQGLAYWTGELNNCGTNAVCTHNRRIGISAAFFMHEEFAQVGNRPRPASLEFQQTGDVIYRLYRAAYGTLPGAPSRANLLYAQFMPDRAQLVGGPQLAQNTIDFTNQFVARSAFKTSYPDAMTALEFVNKLFDTANLTPYTTERQQEADALANGAKTRAQVLLDVIGIAEFVQREANPAFVLNQYFGYLRRNPDQAGYDFWLNVLQNRDPNNFLGMVCSFITSREYQERFSTATSRRNADCLNNGPTNNRAPAVDGGSERTTTLPNNTVNLTATVADDGQPSGSSLSFFWSKESGPGTVTFSPPDRKDTVATFSVPGIYLLRISVDDSQLTNYDLITVTVRAAGDVSGPTLTFNPANGTTVNSTTPLIEINYLDDDSGVDTTTLLLTIDGTNYTSLFTITGTKAFYQVALGGGQHTIQVSLRDLAGNLSQGTSRFSISVFRSLPEAIPTTGSAPLAVTFITKGEYTDGAINRYRWDFQGDGIFDTNDPGARNYSRTFTQRGTFNAVLEILNDRNQIATATVTIVVTGSPPVANASVNPSNGAVPLNVSFIGSGTDSDGTIAKFEWDFEGDGVFDFSSTSTGNTSHTYSTAGTFNAVFRVTDNTGLTGTATATATAIRTGPPGSPTATISLPANPLTITAPTTVNFNGSGSDPGGSITKYEWDFNGDGVYEFSSTTGAATSFRYESPGAFTAALRVTDDSNLTGIDTIDVTVNLPVSLALNTDTCKPLQGGTINVNTFQGATTPVTIFIRNRAGQTVKTLVNNVSRTAGNYSDTWDCKDSTGSIVPEGAYYAILQYEANGQTRTLDLTNTTGGTFYNPTWTMSTTGGPACSTCPFKPLENNFLKVDFVLPQASETTVSIRLFNSIAEVVLLFDRRLYGRGTYTAFWDGTDTSGRIVTPPAGEQFLWGMTAFTFPTNGIFVEAAPQLTNVTANPNYFDPATGNFISPQSPTTKINYILSKQASVSLQVFRSGTNTLMRNIVQTGVAAGTGVIEWDGRDDNGIFVDKGDYRLAVKATDATGNQSIVRYVLVRVFY